jgi:DNA-directed RNA polymerase subunit RPC12/RpoP
MNRKVIIIATIVGLVVAGVMAFTFHHPADNGAHPDGTWWRCNACGHEFSLSTRALGDWYQNHYGEGVKCPSCGSQKTVRSYKCPSCGKVYPTHNAKKCPACGAPVPPAQ